MTPALLFGRCGACSCLSVSAGAQIIRLRLQSEEGEIGFRFLFVGRHHFSFFLFQSRAADGGCSLLPVGLGSSRASAGSVPCLGCVLLARGPARGRWDERVRGSRTPSHVKQPQFSQQLCNSSTSGRHKNVLKMTFFVSFFSLPALSPRELSRPGCQFKNSLNHSRRVRRISALSVIYTVLPGPLRSVTEKQA